ncbi:MAG: 1-acyl-sn-glycerol-3-phosphate acyltransferase [Thermoleophilaceae bacterium]|nr:1-acyl-sn-glycerol-3-phosphate acyltransferase [Thermoleophilaceae bacterium]
MAMKEQVYIDERDAAGMAKYHERVRNHKPSAMYDLVRVVMTGTYGALDRVAAIDVQNVPRAGGTIFVPNHFSFIDHFFTGIHLRRKLQFMAKSQLFKPPLDFVYSHGGVFPVMRGKGDTETFITAKAILDRGGVAQMYAEGGRSRDYYPTVAKRGAGQLAIMSGKPVVPVAIYGSQFLRDVKRHWFPKVIVRYGRPLQFTQIDEPTKEQSQIVSEEIFRRVLEMWWEMDAEFEPKWRRAERARTGEVPRRTPPAAQ